MNPAEITHFIICYTYYVPSHRDKQEDTQVISAKNTARCLKSLQADPGIENIEVYAVTAHYRCRFPTEKQSLQNILQEIEKL
jgi:hypothetical protein